VTFSAICRASSRLRLRPKRGCHSLMVSSIRLSFAGFDGFTEDLTVGSSPHRAPGLRLRNHTDSGGPYLCFASAGPNHRDPALHIPLKFIASESKTLACLDRDAALSRLHRFDNNSHFEKPVASSFDQFTSNVLACLLHLFGPLTAICLISRSGISCYELFHCRRSEGVSQIGLTLTGARFFARLSNTQIALQLQLPFELFTNGQRIKARSDFPGARFFVALHFNAI
jgi:hypothetical protein